MHAGKVFVFHYTSRLKESRTITSLFPCRDTFNTSSRSFFETTFILFVNLDGKNFFSILFKAQTLQCTVYLSFSELMNVNYDIAFRFSIQCAFNTVFKIV